MVSGKRIVVVLIPLFVIAAWPGGHMGSPVALAQPENARASRVVLVVDHWRLVGTLVDVRGSGRKPAALLLNKAAGNREAYAQLAGDLGRRGINSLRLDLRGHGDSVSLGRFTPGASDAAELLNGTSNDVTAALTFLRQHPRVDDTRIAVVGASYSAEAMAAAARVEGRYAAAYVALSPGSFSEESARAIDDSGADWLFVRAARERSQAVAAATDTVSRLSRESEMWVLDASSHATDLLGEQPSFVPRLVDWIATHLHLDR